MSGASLPSRSAPVLCKRGVRDVLDGLAFSSPHVCPFNFSSPSPSHPSLCSPLGCARSDSQRQCFLALLLLHGIPTNPDGSVDWSSMCRHFSSKQAYDVAKVRGSGPGSEEAQGAAAGLNHLLQVPEVEMSRGSNACFLLVLPRCPTALLPRCPAAPLPRCPAALLPCCPAALLPCCPVLLPCCPGACLQYGALLMTRVAAAASGSTEPSGEFSCLCLQ